jgi:uncharacterized protein (TIGR00369 family)
VGADPGPGAVLSTARVSTVPLPIVDAGPEALFRVGRVVADGATVRGSMPLGPWLHGPDGAISAGSLGVLIDNVLGYAIIATRPPDHWSVSTEITLDVFDGLRSGRGTRFAADAHTVHADAVGGFATGQVYDEGGDLVAQCTQRGRFVPAGSAFDETPAPDGLVLDADDMAALIDATATPGSDGVRVHLETTAALQNPMHNLHGGIALAASDLAGCLALAETPGPPLVTASVHIVYARPIRAGAAPEFRATVAHRGRTLGLVDVVGLVDGRPCTIARVTSHPGT